MSVVAPSGPTEEIGDDLARMRLRTICRSSTVATMLTQDFRGVFTKRSRQTVLSSR